MVKCRLHRLPFLHVPMIDASLHDEDFHLGGSLCRWHTPRAAVPGRYKPFTVQSLYHVASVAGCKNPLRFTPTLGILPCLHILAPPQLGRSTRIGLLRSRWCAFPENWMDILILILFVKLLFVILFLLQDVICSWMGLHSLSLSLSLSLSHRISSKHDLLFLIRATEQACILSLSLSGRQYLATRRDLLKGHIYSPMQIMYHLSGQRALKPACTIPLRSESHSHILSHANE